MKLLRSTYLSLFLIFLFSSCEEVGTGRLIIRLIDSPGDYEAVYIDVQEVKIHRTGGDGEEGWESLETNAGIYDLLQLTGGSDVVLVDSEIPAGKISQIRLILGDNNTLIINGEEKPLKTPSAQTSGLKIKINQELQDGVTYTIVLDFDAARSIVSTGPKKFKLSPVIRAVAEARSGSASGIVMPAEENVAVYVKSGTATLATSYAPKGSNDWKIGGLEPGTFSFEFDPGDDSIYKSTMIDNVEIVLGENTDLGTVTLELK